MASFDEKPNGGLLSLEAQFGTKTFHPIKRLEPTPDTAAQDPDQPTPTTDEPITRAYLVELRVGFQTRTKTTSQEPYLYCIYATADCQQFFERRLPIDYGEDAMGVGGHHIEITFAHPDLAGWMRAHEANAGGNGGR